MISIATSIVLGLSFVLVGGINIWLVLESWSRVKSTNASARMLSLHRIGGYLFLALFCAMGYFMLSRLRNGAADSPVTTIHVALAMILSPLLFLKILIARYYKNQSNLLLPIGMTIFVLAFVLVASTAGPYFARVSQMEEVSTDPGRSKPVMIDVNQASELMQKRCSKCHNLDRVVGARKDTQGWMATVDRMRSMPGAGISDADAKTIATYLVSQVHPKASAADARTEVARALVDQRCGRCHSLDRVYKEIETPDQWRVIVSRMVAYADGSTGALLPGEDRQIIEYLSATQTPEAAARRKAQAAAAASTGRSLIAQKAAAAPANPTRASRYDIKAIGYISLVCLSAVALIVRRPRPRRPDPGKAPTQPASALPVTKRSNGPFVLELVKIIPQTHDSKTLRFRVRGEMQMDALAGQFLTFSFLFDGRKETRCYSICSSPARSGYVEITPKRTNNGCVSVFLNDRASLGMTIEATGPFGQFYFDPLSDKNVVLLAAGSGITPMMAMLRYMDDLCLETDATLLYCVRTAKDVFFRDELEELQSRLPRFRFQLLLSQPGLDWPGARGHIHREFICQNVPDIDDRVSFLCGPPPFMYEARTILIDLGVSPERIRQETFGGAGAIPKSRSHPKESGFQIEFARSGKTVAVLEDQTLLEAAAGAGVEIPSACRQGQCGTCMTRLITGRVRMSAEQGLDSQSRGRGFVLTCVGYAEGNVTLEA